MTSLPVRTKTPRQEPGQATLHRLTAPHKIHLFTIAQKWCHINSLVVSVTLYNSPRANEEPSPVIRQERLPVTLLPCWTKIFRILSMEKKCDSMSKRHVTVRVARDVCEKSTLRGKKGIVNNDAIVVDILYGGFSVMFCTQGKSSLHSILNGLQSWSISKNGSWKTSKSSAFWYRQYSP